jgi:hypothetical protein
VLPSGRQAGRVQIDDLVDGHENAEYGHRPDRDPGAGRRPDPGVQALDLGGRGGIQPPPRIWLERAMRCSV